MGIALPSSLLPRRSLPAAPRGLSKPLRPAVAAAAVAAAVALFALPAAADTMASSAIFNSFSASVGSISTSFNASSDASSPGRPLRAGDYRVSEIVAAAGRDGYVRLTLRALNEGVPDTAAAADDAYHLYLPVQTVARAALVAGQVISARGRPYGLELARLAADGRTREAFFLVVDDERYRELQTRAVTL